ncbi:MAG: ImmA/IrrE family metallo-endopeptidase [Phycisphaeraceae bacterium]|nr:MAG: ImmA/IrrE family metallo-endopeptidase [Phycisphaeraceae bacterium]
MSRRGVARKDRVPYLDGRVIEEHAEQLLGEWALKHGEVALPVPLDDLVEMHLGLDYEIDDLCGQFGSRDVLGAIWFGDRVICIDASLDPTENPHLLGRFNFTLAHEIAHWWLHRQHLMDDPSAAPLFEKGGEPAFVCRSSAKPREEWQADHFAGCLLMPRRMLRKEWAKWHGSDEPVALTDLDIVDHHGDRQANENMAMERFCKPLAERFAASAQAMRIRLQSLELLVKEKEPGLF